MKNKVSRKKTIPTYAFRLKRIGLTLALLASTLTISEFQVGISQAATFNAADFNLSGTAKNCAVEACAPVPTGYNSTSPTSTSISGEVQLTASLGTQAGFAWSKERISLESNFDIQAQIYLGSNNAGADGLAFVLQTISTSSGSSGGGLGYGNIGSPCFAVEFDTYQNSDIANDHAALMNCNNVRAHNNFAPSPTTANATSDSVDLGNIEDGYWRNVRFIWTAQPSGTG